MASQLAQIESIEDGRVWTAEHYHRVSPKQIAYETRGWRLVKNKGIQVFGEKGVRRSPGEPTTLRRIRTDYGAHLADFQFAELALAIIANESRGTLVCDRYEERIKDWSFGPGQFLSNTAYGLLREAGQKAPSLPIPSGGSVEAWRRYLCHAENTIDLIRLFITRLNTRFVLKGDPILIYAAYNAGSPRPSVSTNDWGLVTHKPETLDKLAAWLGDAYATRPTAVA